MDQNCIKNNKNKSQKQTKRKKKYGRHYCDVCCKNYTNYMSFKIHMKTFHGQSIINKHTSSEDGSIFKSKHYFFEPKKTKNGIGKTDNIFTEFEDQMPSELKNDHYRCNVCNKIFVNSIDYMNHEKSHYQTLINNSSVSQKSMTFDVDMALDISNDDGTIGDIVNNDKSLETFDDDSTILNTSNNNDKSLDVLDYDTSTSDTSNNDITSDTSNNDINSDTSNNDITSDTSNNDITSDTSNNDTTSDTCDFRIICNSCEGEFTSKSDFEEHLEYNVDDNLTICRNQTNLIFLGPIEHNKNIDNNSLFNSKINIPEKKKWIPDENHLKVLNEICVVQQPFDCEICNETCDQFDHYQFHQWWSPGEILKCHVCNQKFSDKEQLKLHEYEHVKTHFC